jgi:hypothetical protein
VSNDAVRAVVRRALGDEEFRETLMDRPYDALEGYALEPEEQGALLAGSATLLAGMGVDAETASRYTDLFHISRGGGG